MSAVARWRATTRLADYAIEDRAASALVLYALATDHGIRPPLRWRLAKDLADLGASGRGLAIEVLQSMIINEWLPVTARAEAVRLLARLRPDRAHEALAVLKRLATTENPLHRRQVLLALGALDSAEAWPQLKAMAQDRALSPVVRLRCAEGLAQLRRDQRDNASLVARELMRDQQVAHHVRTHAARVLARWSALCREEARDMLRTLSMTAAHEVR